MSMSGTAGPAGHRRALPSGPTPGWTGNRIAPCTGGPCGRPAGVRPIWMEEGGHVHPARGTHADGHTSMAPQAGRQADQSCLAVTCRAPIARTPTDPPRQRAGVFHRWRCPEQPAAPHPECLMRERDRGPALAPGWMGRHPLGRSWPGGARTRAVAHDARPKVDAAMPCESMAGARIASAGNPCETLEEDPYTRER